jgi:hypothetical protein
MENLDAINITYKCKKTSTAFETWPTICLSLANEGQTHVGWIVVVGQNARKCVKTNNTLPKGSSCCVLHFNKMILGSLCQEACEKYSGDGHASNR